MSKTLPAHIFFVGVCVALLLTPLFASALTLPFGGKVLTLTPCANGAIAVKILPPPEVAYLSGFSFIWYPFTRTYLFGPPRRIGQNLLGVAGPPSICVPANGDLSNISGPTMIQLGSSI